MNKKYKATGFTRLLMFLIFFAPIAYIGASYYNGEDGIANIKSTLGLDQSVEHKIESREKQIQAYENKIIVLKEEIETLKATTSQ